MYCYSAEEYADRAGTEADYDDAREAWADRNIKEPDFLKDFLDAHHYDSMYESFGSKFGWTYSTEDNFWELYEKDAAFSKAVINFITSSPWCDELDEFVTKMFDKHLKDSEDYYD